MPGRHVEGQLVHDRLECIGRRHRCEGGVVGGSDAAVHSSCGGMVGQLKVHGGRRALAVDFDLEGVQGRLAGLGGEAHGRARVDGRQAGSVGGDGALCCGEIRGQGVGGEIGRGGAATWPCSAAMAAALVPMSAVWAVCSV